MKQGQVANRSGKGLEQIIASLVDTWFGLAPMAWHEWQETKTYPAFITNVPFTTVYGTRGRSEFALYISANRRIRIECKWQQVSGSVDEKYPYLLACMRGVDEDTVVIVYGGGGAKEAAIAWLKCAATAVETKQILVQTIDAFAVFLSSIAGG